MIPDDPSSLFDTPNRWQRDFGAFADKAADMIRILESRGFDNEQAFGILYLLLQKSENE